MGYRDTYDRWKADPEAYWLEQAEAIDWDIAPTRALFDRGDHIYEWFADASVNTCYNAVDRHVDQGNGKRVAIIHDSPITGSKSTLTYGELQAHVASLAGALVAQGVEKGDRVVIYMPMVPEAVEAMLACARIGAIHSRRSSPPPAGWSRRGWWITNRCLTEPSNRPATSLTPASSCNAARNPAS